MNNWIFKSVVQENFSIFSATTPKVQFYHSNKTRNHTKQERKGERREGREKKRTGIPRLIVSSTLERQKAKKKRQNGAIFCDNVLRNPVRCRLTVYSVTKQFLLNFIWLYIFQTKHDLTDLTYVVGATYILPSGNSLFIIKYHIHEMIHCCVQGLVYRWSLLIYGFEVFHIIFPGCTVFGKCLTLEKHGYKEGKDVLYLSSNIINPFTPRVKPWVNKCGSNF